MPLISFSSSGSLPPKLKSGCGRHVHDMIYWYSSIRSRTVQNWQDMYAHHATERHANKNGSRGTEAPDMQYVDDSYARVLEVRLRQIPPFLQTRIMSPCPERWRMETLNKNVLLPPMVRIDRGELTAISCLRVSHTSPFGSDCCACLLLCWLLVWCRLDPFRRGSV